MAELRCWTKFHSPLVVAVVLRSFQQTLFKRTRHAAPPSSFESLGFLGIEQQLQSRDELLRRQRHNKISPKPQITERTLKGLNKTWRQVAVSLQKSAKGCQAASASSPCLIGPALSAGNTKAFPRLEDARSAHRLPCPA